MPKPPTLKYKAGGRKYDIEAILNVKNGNALIRWAGYKTPTWQSVMTVCKTQPYKDFVAAQTLLTVPTKQKKSGRATEGSAATGGAGVSSPTVPSSPTTGKRKRDEETDPSPSPYPSAKRAASDSVKTFVNILFGKLLNSYGSRQALVLDDPTTWRSCSVALQIASSFKTITVVNKELEKGCVFSHENGRVEAHAGELKDWLAANEDKKFDAAFLDFCGLLETCKKETKTVLSRLGTGLNNRGSPFLVTYNKTRGGDGAQATKGWLEGAFTDAKLHAEYVGQFDEGPVVTFGYVLRSPVSELLQKY